MKYSEYNEFFRENGYVHFKGAINFKTLGRMNNELLDWINESKKHKKNYGSTIDGRPRFDLEIKTHSKDNPALRRVSSPIEISDTFLSFTRDNPALDLTAHIFSPNIKLLATKINLKLPGSGTSVKYHQDFPFEPHSNDDIMTVLYFLDDVTFDNGPLEVVPGSHKGKIYSLWQDGIFTGAVDKSVEDKYNKLSVKCTGIAGDACLMHSRLLHGSLPNLTNQTRNLFIITYVAEDAYPLVKNPLPNKYEGEIVKGKKTGLVRSTTFKIEVPEFPKEASFFGQQKKVK